MTDSTPTPTRPHVGHPLPGENVSFLTDDEMTCDARIAALEEVVGSLEHQLDGIGGQAGGRGVMSADAQVAELRAELAELRQQIATEVRTRRLVVVDPSGFERVVAKATGDLGSVSVVSPRGVYVALVADEQSAEPSAEVFLSGGGNGAGRFGVIGYGEYIGDEQGGYRVDPETAEYVASLGIIPDHLDPRFHNVSLDREGLHFGG